MGSAHAAPVAGAVAPAAPAPPREQPCLNCGAPLAGPYCAACGQRHRAGRLTLRSVVEDLATQVLNFDRGLWPTIARLTRNPGAVIRDYIDGRRRRYVGPVAYLLFGGALALLAFRLSEQMDTAWIQAEVNRYTGGPDPVFSARQGEAYRSFLLAARGSQAVLSLLTAVPFALMVRAFFPRSGINVAEAAVFTLYSLGHFLLVYALFEPLLVVAGHRGFRATVSVLLGCAIAAHAGLTFFSPRLWTAMRMILAYLLSIFVVSLSGLLFIFAFVR